MHLFDERLRELSQQMARQKKLEAMLHDLSMQKFDLESKVANLKAQKDKEQADVDRLEGGSLASFFYSVFGNKEEKLAKEREEAHAAAVKYDAAVQELEAVIEDIARYQAEAANYINCESEYIMLLTKKAYSIKEASGPVATQILQLEERSAFLENQKREVSEAVAAGTSAHQKAEAALAKLSQAKGWGTWDMVGGGLLTDMIKYSAMDDAQCIIQSLQVDIRRFKTELADVSINVNLQVSVDGMLRFADYFFDNLFTDWAVMDRINRSYNQVVQTSNQIENVLRTLRSMQTNIESEQQRIKDQIEKLIIGA